MNRSKMFMLLLSKKPWSDYEWAKQTGITRATFGNNRKNRGERIRAKTLELMAKSCGLELIQNNSNDRIRPNSKDARFELLVVNTSTLEYVERIKELEKENKLLKELVSNKMS